MDPHNYGDNAPFDPVDSSINTPMVLYPFVVAIPAGAAFVVNDALLNQGKCESCTFSLQ